MQGRLWQVRDELYWLTISKYTEGSKKKFKNPLQCFEKFEMNIDKQMLHLERPQLCKVG